MTLLDRGQPVEVHVGPCRCPDRAHAQTGDTVWLAPTVPVALGVAAMSALRGIANTTEYIGILGALYLRFGIVAWSFVDDDGRSVPITGETVERLLPWGQGGWEVAERADALYGEEVLAPLAKRSSTASDAGQTATSTSATPQPSPVTPISPARSSRTATAGTRSADPAP